MSKIQVLVSTMHRADCSDLVDAMNIKSDAIIINQNDCVNYEELNFEQKKISVYTVDDIGLSKSRNLALMKSSAELICIADDDMVYSNNYVEDIISEFNRQPDADAILFYVKSLNGREGSQRIKRKGRLGKFEYKEFCSVEIVVKREKLLASNIWFNALFGSGSKYKCGEDSIFIKDLMKHGFKIYKSNKQIATVDMSESSWFDGYTKEFFVNKGALVYAIYPRLWFLAIVVLSIKNSKNKLGSYKKVFELFSWYYEGAFDYKSKIN